MSEILGNPLLLVAALLAATAVGLVCLRYPALLLGLSIFTVSLDYMGRIADTTITYNNLLKVTIFAAFGIHMLRSNLSVKIPRHLLMILPFALFVGVSALHSPSLTKGVFYFIRMIILWMFTLAVANFVRDRRDLMIIFGIAAVSALVSSSFAHLQTINMLTFGTVDAISNFEPGEFGVRAVSTFWNPNRLALFLLNVSIFLLVALRHPRLSRPWKSLVIVILATSLAAILLTFSRAAWVSLCFASLCFLRFGETRRIILAMGALAVATIGLIALFTPYGALLLERATSFAELGDDFSTKFRTYLGYSGLRIWADGMHWLWGSGYASFPLLFREYLHPLISHEMSYHSGITASHMLYVTILSETGLIGMGLFILFIRAIFKSFRHLFRRQLDPTLRLVLIGCWVLVVTRLLDWFFNPDIHYNEFWFVLGLMGAVELISAREQVPEPALSD